ncbi:MAG: hypothetical protein JWN84_2437 [Nocardioides sp.]|jgi:hypothetical protein|nr:hypothetical protein [Nocardioides sp.]
MAQTAVTPEIEFPTIPLSDLGPWATFFGLFAAIVVFFISADQGAISIPAGTMIHEWVHDARHLLGYPCH